MEDTEGSPTHRDIDQDNASKAVPQQAPGYGVSPAMERERAHWQQVAPHLRRGRKQPRGGFKGPDGRIR